MASPPAYETVVSETWRAAKCEKATKQGEKRWNISEVVAASRTQHVGLIVEQLLPEIKSRAQQGYSRIELILIPADENNARMGQLVNLHSDQPPLIIQFEGEQNSTPFWSQQAVIAETKRQLIDALVTQEDVVEAVSPAPIPQAMPKAKSRSSSWFGRRVKEPETPLVITAPKQPPVSIDVVWDDVFCRSETEYGLFETKRASAVLIVVDVR